MNYLSIRITGKNVRIFLGIIEFQYVLSWINAFVLLHLILKLKSSMDIHVAALLFTEFVKYLELADQNTRLFDN